LEGEKGWNILGKYNVFWNSWNDITPRYVLNLREGVVMGCAGTSKFEHGLVILAIHKMDVLGLTNPCSG